SRPSDLGPTGDHDAAFSAITMAVFGDHDAAFSVITMPRYAHYMVAQRRQHSRVGHDTVIRIVALELPHQRLVLLHYRTVPVDSTPLVDPAQRAAESR